MSDERKRVADLVPGDRVALTPTSTGEVITAQPSHSTMQAPRRGGTPGIATIVVFRALDGRFRGAVEAEFRHPEDRILCR